MIRHLSKTFDLWFVDDWRSCYKWYCIHAATFGLLAGTVGGGILAGSSVYGSLAAYWPTYVAIGAGMLVCILVIIGRLWKQ